MIVKQVPVHGVITTNSYFYIDEGTKHGFLIDAGAEADTLLQVIKSNGWTIEKILITHGHFDHIGAVEHIAKELNIPYLAHRNGSLYLSDPIYNLSRFFESDIILNNAEYADEGDEITLKAAPSVKLRVIHTPGHTRDGVVYYDANNAKAFVGDTIFKHSIGRTDIPGGDFKQLMQTIENKIFTLPDETILYSGHSAPTSVGAEKRSG